MACGTLARRDRRRASTPAPGDPVTDDLQPARWFVLVDGEQTGPFDLAEVRDRVLAGDVGPDTYVWADGMDDWRVASETPALVPPASADAPAAWQGVPRR